MQHALDAAILQHAVRYAPNFLSEHSNAVSITGKLFMVLHSFRSADQRVNTVVAAGGHKLKHIET